MASLQKRKNKGHEYYYIVESKRINGKPTHNAYTYSIDNDTDIVCIHICQSKTRSNERVSRFYII